MGQPRWSSPGHNRTHIGVCLLDTNRRAALARILLDGSATLDAAQAALGHGAAIMPAYLRVFLALVLLPRFYIHTSRRHHTSLVRDPLTACCPADHATHVEARVEAATTAPHIELSSPLAPTRHHGPRRQDTEDEITETDTAGAATFGGAQPPPVAQDRSHRLLCQLTSAHLLPCPPHLIPISGRPTCGLSCYPLLNGNI